MCVGIVLNAQDGTAVPSRTLEFAFDLKSNLVVVPQGTQIRSLSMNPGKDGFAFTAKYGFGGANGLDMPIVFDGVNTAGLYFGAFYFAGDAVYKELTPDNQGRAVSSEELGNWVLAMFANVDEVVEGLKTVDVVGTHIDAIDSIAPFHYLMVDRSGKSIVLEFTKRGMEVHENTVGVVTNNPTYEWHMVNLRNYVGLSAENKTAIEVGRATVAPFGQGSGLVGLPGDSTSSSRFVRAVAFRNSALPSETAADAVFQAFHIMNNFDIPKGSIRDTHGETVHYDYSMWTSAVDTRKSVYFYKTYITQAVESFHLNAALANVTKPTVVKMETGFKVTDRSAEFQ